MAQFRLGHFLLLLYNNRMLIDTHCHLHDREWFTPDQQAEFLQHAHENGIEKIICIGTNHEDSLKARDFAMKHAGVYWTYGIHPDFANDHREGEALSSFEIMELDSSGGRGSESLDDESVPAIEKEDKASHAPVAIGEIGLDYHYDQYDRTAQIRLFEQMLQLAIDHDLPVSLHIREAFTDAFAVLDNFPGVKGVVHSFTGSKKELKKALERGFYIGVNGLATYTTPPLPPLDRILLETDAPFLTPVPFRGTINKPGYVKQIAAYLATKLGVTELEIAEQTTKNARQIFKV